MSRRVRVVVDCLLDEGSMYLRDGTLNEDYLKDHAAYVIGRDVASIKVTVEDLGETSG